MEKHQINFATQSFQQHGWLYQYPACFTSEAVETNLVGNDGNKQRLLLIHGAGVAGELTWTFITNYLDQWQEVLVIDLVGMGGSRFINAPQRVAVGDFSHQIEELLAALDWHRFDVAGYSFGGMVAVDYLERCLAGVFFNALFLIEPAMLFSQSSQVLRHKGKEYQAIAEAVRQNPNDIAVYRRFLDSVSPNRRANPQVDQMTMTRLSASPDSFAQVLQAVHDHLDEHAERFCDWHSPWPGGSFVGGLSPQSMMLRHQLLSKRSTDWQFHTIAAADHSLVFTKPRAIARKMNEIKAGLLGR